MENVNFHYQLVRDDDGHFYIHEAFSLPDGSLDSISFDPVASFAPMSMDTEEFISMLRAMVTDSRRHATLDIAQIPEALFQRYFDLTDIPSLAQEVQAMRTESKVVNLKDFIRS